MYSLNNIKNIYVHSQLFKKTRHNTNECMDPPPPAHKKGKFFFSRKQKKVLKRKNMQILFCEIFARVPTKKKYFPLEPIFFFF